MARILVIDDEEPIRHLLRLILELAGHDILLAEDGLRGIGVVRREHPDLIILDVMMPVMDGGTVLGNLQADERTRGIPILVLTAATVSSLHARLLRSGAARVMSKPFDPADVVQAVAELVPEAEAQVSTRESEPRPSSASAAVGPTSPSVEGVDPPSSGLPGGSVDSATAVGYAFHRFVPKISW